METRINSITFTGDGGSVTIEYNATDLFWKSNPSNWRGAGVKGIPYDADDSMMWEFCTDILLAIEKPPHLGFPNIRIAKIYQALELMIDYMVKFEGLEAPVVERDFHLSSQ